VTSELERLAAEEAEKLRATADDISKQAESPSLPDPDAPSLTDKLSGAAADKEKKLQLSHSSVSKEIADLKKKLEGRRKVEQLDPAVQMAKDELVACLRMNDRRPLDCWKEKEAFKREVGRLEREFVERTVR
jgi:altered-inheritance-of-mitochondria protein 13